MLAIYGAGGFALQILDMVEALANAGTPVCLVDESLAGELHGFPIVRPSEVPANADAIVTVADPAVRARIASGLANFTRLVASSARIHASSTIGEGSILCHNTVVEPDVSIGRHFHGNIYSYVAHESRLGDFVTFAPRVSCNGRVTIEDGAYLGAGAVIKQGVSIGAGAVVGMGAVVVRDVPAGATVVGNPARVIR